MNNRINELAIQAGADFMRRINYNNLEGEEYEEDAGVIFDSNESFKKFAELIVRDCMDVVDGYTKSRTFDTHYDAVEQIEALFGIKHNGVEE